MPRPGWLALGGCVAALLVPSAGLAPAAAAAVALLAGLGTASAARLLRRSWLAWAGLGVALVAARLIAGSIGEGAERNVPEPGAMATMHEATVVTLYAPGNGQQRVVVALEPIAGGARVWLTLPRYPALAAEQRIRFDARLEPAPARAESGFGEFLARSGVAWTARVREFEVAPGPQTPAAGLETIRRRGAELITRAMPETEAGLSAAMLIGLRDLVARDVAADFRTSGLSHVVAISGFHMALLAATAEALLRPLARRPRSLVVLSVIAAYAILAGASPSVLRAALMCAVVIVARESGRRGRPAGALALTVLALLLLDPTTISDVGFQLSVAATAGLLRWGDEFGEALRARLPRIVPRWLIEALAVTLAAQLATLPLVLAHFGRLSLVAPLANLLAAPFVAPSMAAAGAAMLSGGLREIGVPGVVLAPLDLAATLTVGAIVAIARASADLPLATVELPGPLGLAAAGVASLLVVALLRPRPRRPAHAEAAREPRPSGGARMLMPAGLLAAVITVVLAGSVRPDGRLHMTVLDVGQGDAVLLRGPAGSRILVDTGPDPDLLLAELDRRVPAWDRRIDMVVITHPHEDHVAGLALLLDRYRVGVVAEPGMIGLGPGDAAFRQRLAELGRSTRVLAAGDRFTFDGVDALVHWPMRGRVPPRASDGGKEVNNVSIVLELRFGERRVLLTGDVEQEIDPLLLAAGITPAGSLPLDVLKVAHHGSATASTEAFLERVRPRVAVISAGVANAYGHPSPATIARLENGGAQLFRTDLDGSIEIVTDGRTLTVDSAGRSHAAQPSTAAVAGGAGFCPIAPAAFRPVGGGRPRAPYNRVNGRPIARRGLSAVARTRSARLAGRALGRRRRGGRVHRPVDGAAWRHHRPPAGRDGGLVA